MAALRGCYPTALAALNYPGLDDGPSTNELLESPTDVIRDNEMVLEEEIWTEEGPWDSRYLVIGHHSGGDMVALDLDDASLPVYRLLTEVARYERVAENLDQYVAQLTARCTQAV